MSTIHVKPPYREQITLTIEEANAMIQSGELPPESLAWKVGMTEWVSISAMEGIVLMAPPPLPSIAPQNKPETTELNPLAPQAETTKRKTSAKAVWSFILVLLGILTIQSGAGVFLLLAGIVLGYFASRDIKNHKDVYSGAGWLKAGRVLVLLIFALFAFSMALVFLPSGSKVVDTTKRTEPIPLKQEEPEKTQTVTGKILNYTYQVPASYKVQYTTANLDSVASAPGIVVGVHADEKTYESLDFIYKFLRKHAESRGGSHFMEPEHVLVNDKEWLCYAYKSNDNGVESAWCAWIYTGPEGTIRFAFKTENKPFDIEFKKATPILESFQFH